MIKIKQFDLILKRIFDVFFVILIFPLIIFPLLVGWVIAAFSTNSFGIFSQKRVGKHGKIFVIYKLKTMVDSSDTNSVTTTQDIRITSAGKYLRKYKLDELPQFYNVLLGEMSVVGPRPDVPGYADELIGDDRLMLEIPPGITGPASLFYFDEEKILAQVEDPVKYNKEVIWPQKVSINNEYVATWSLWKDLQIIFRTVIKHK